MFLSTQYPPLKGAMPMTDEEKKAEAAKAEAEKKAKEEAEKATKAKDEENDDDPPEPEPKDEAKAHIKKLNEENKKHRLENKSLKERLDKYDKVFATLQGKEKPDLDPVLQAKTEAEGKMKRTLLKAELATVARDAHDAGALFKAFPEKFKDIEVDMESETVDRDALTEAVDSIRSENPWMFAPKDGEGSTTKGKPPPKGPPDKGAPQGNGSHAKHWQALKKAGKAAEAQKYYNENKSYILMQL